MNFSEWIDMRGNTSRMTVVEYTVRKPRLDLLGRPILSWNKLPLFYDTKQAELQKPEGHDKKTQFMGVLRIKLKGTEMHTWDTFLGWLQRWKATKATIVLAKSLWKEFTRCMRNLRIINGHVPNYS